MKCQTTSRRECRMTYREAARGLILTPAQELLLLKIRLPGVPEPFWIAPGGGLESGERAEDALRRELQEELGLIDFEQGPLVWRRQHTFTFRARRICQRESYFIIRAARFEPHMMDDMERDAVDEVRWWPVAELRCAAERLTPLTMASIVEQFLWVGPPATMPAIEIVVD